MTVEPLITSTRADDPCGTPECPEKRGYGLFANFCSPCADRLAVIRRLYEADTDAYNPRKASVRHSRERVCSSPYCFNVRTLPDAFCPSCTDDGLVEDAA